ncbi:Putative phage infection protein [Corynebacterium glyciniphilum AJ 3170]|uniref:Putative phage infection protein n=1 Tax=Corynebacterium glyciniphilum AJ 3170 TaxID=1404245 RepID=X5ECW9_9CORY|nr:YhgE/Pip domain-containing protein [Corynebacterium glyciniphilum]AHW65225.1 Putative phage infection protein [Corynebacterium glyciniphilum AJ 3170]
MKKAMNILRSDLRGMKNNVMTAVVVFSLVVIPLLFSTFNVLASWNPFGNTDQLKIAVASADDGYESDLASLRINLGDQVLSQLSRNDQIDWVITAEDKAVEGTKAGDYYAAIVLPPSFSTDMLTFYVAGTEPSKLDLYTNEKKNALSTVITAQGADGMISQINETFTRTLSSVGLGLVSSLDDYLEQDDTQAAIQRIESRVENISTRLHSGAQTVRSLTGLVDSSIPLVQGADSIISAAGDQFDDPSTSIGGGSGAATDLDSTLRNATDSLETALQATGDSYGAVSDRLGELFDSANATSDSTASTFNTLADRVQQQVDFFQSLRDTLESNVSGALPDVAQPGYERVLARLDAAIDRSTDLQNSFAQTAEDISSGNGSAQSSRQESQDAISQARAAVSDAVTSYREDLKPQLSELGTTLDSLGDNIASVREDLGDIRSSTSDSPGSVQDVLGRTRDATAGLADRLDEHAERFSDLQDALSTAGETGDFSRLAEVVGSDPEALASQLAAPIDVDRQPVFPVASFGVGMTPLYLTLALWIGAVLTSVLLRTGVPEKKRDGKSSGEAEDTADGEAGGEADVKADSDADSDTEVNATAPGQNDASDEVTEYTRSQAFFGRFAIFACIGLAQSTLAVLGLIFFVQIDAAHPILLLVCGWVTSLVFMLIVYTLVLSFGSAGKAISVLLLVFQVSGAGGAYPLALLPGWFQSISPWLPATHAIDAMRAAIAGVYQGDLWIELGLLLLFAVPMLILGLVLRGLLDGYNRKTTEAIESTKIMQ